MPKSKFSKARITGIVTCIPENYKLIDDELYTLYNGDKKQLERIKKNIGLNKRHIVKGETTTADLCEKAAEVLLSNMDVDRTTIDAVFLVTQTPDYFQPATAAYLHGRLGLNKTCAAFDVNQGCAGYIYGLWLAFMMIESGSCERVLFLAGDTPSKIVNPLDSNTTPLFGDAGSATLIEKTDNLSSSFFLLYTDGTKFDVIIQPQGAFRRPRKGLFKDERIFNTSQKRTLSDLYMDGIEVFNFTIDAVPKSIQELLDYSKKELKDVDFLILQQANKFVISNIARKLNFPIEKTPNDIIGEYGNQSSASIPCTICGTIREDVINRKVKLILSGYGVGLSWGCCYLELDRIHCAELVSYMEE